MRVSEGDLRRAITFLQSAARLSVDKEISERTITDIAGVIQRSATEQTSLISVQPLSRSGLGQVVPHKMIDSLLHICFRGTFERLEVEVRVCVALASVSASSYE